MSLSLPDIIVTDRHTAGQILRSCSPGKGRDIRHLISIGDKPEDAPPLHAHGGTVLRLEFDDISCDDRPQWGYVGLSWDQAYELIEYCKRIKASPARTLVHCTAGVSRSSAAALVLIAVILGPGQEIQAVKCLSAAIQWAGKQLYRDHREKEFPNRRVVSMCDSLLGLEGRLLEARDKKYEDETDAEFIEMMCEVVRDGKDPA